MKKQSDQGLPFAILQADTFFLTKLILSKPLVNNIYSLGDTILPKMPAKNA